MNATTRNLDEKPPPADWMRQLNAERRRRRLTALAMVAPLGIFLLITFIAPILTLLYRAVDNPEIVSTLPRTVAVLERWDRRGTVPEDAFAALASDLAAAKGEDGPGAAARRLNSELPGLRSVVMKTTRLMPLTGAGGGPLTSGEVRTKLIEIDPRWGDLDVWQVIAKNGKRRTPAYLLAALDLSQDAFGHVQRVPESEAIYTRVLARTFWMSLVVTCCCLLLGYPLAYWLSILSERRANLLMVFVLIPFWTSILVRIAAFMVLLQSEGLVNKALMAAHITSHPLELLFNRVGVYIAMVQILLPFMILPLYSVMKGIPKSYLRAAVSLGSHPFAAFWHVYAPATAPGVAAGVLLVFILALGYYITPALLGGPNEQMVSYYIAYFTNVTINWGMAAALGALLLVATLVLYAVYRRFANVDVNVA